VNGIRSCGLPAHCCQPAVAGGVIYADLRGELRTHLALQALFTQRSPVHDPLLQAFPFPSTLGKVTLHLLSQASVFVYSSSGKWVFPPLLCSFPPSAALTSFPAPGCWAHAPAPAGASLACPACLFTVPERIPFPQSLALSAPHPLSRMSLFSYCLLLSFSFFPKWRSVCPGGCAALAQSCLWEYRGTSKLTLSTSSYVIWVRATGSLGALLVSPYNVKWRFSELAGGVEGSKFFFHHF
jgi:hypothetical protein